jgi:hypothetical protein
MSKSPNTDCYSTIHHLPFKHQQVRRQFAYGDKTPSKSLFASVYTPAETVLGVTDPQQAYHQAQGFAVNKYQDARHMVRSACPGDIIEVVHADGTQEFYFVDPVGFDELPFEQPVETAAEQSATDGKPAL